MTDSEICKNNGWKVGTRLIEDESYGTTVIEITAIGEALVLAKIINHNGDPPAYDGEKVWRLRYRKWREVSPS